MSHADKNNPDLGERLSLFRLIYRLQQRCQQLRFRRSISDFNPWNPLSDLTTEMLRFRTF